MNESIDDFASFDIMDGDSVFMHQHLYHYIILIGYKNYLNISKTAAFLILCESAFPGRYSVMRLELITNKY